MRVLVLDDMQERHDVMGPMLRKQGHDVVEVRTFAEAAEALRGPRFDEMWLDHDLDDELGELDAAHGLIVPKPIGMTGTHVAELVVALPSEKRPGMVRIHSWNPEGARRMAQILADHKIPHGRYPFSPRWADDIRPTAGGG